MRRFIPAGAGNTPGTQRLENMNHGSSPQVRGTRSQSQPEFQIHRFIPAGAGNTFLLEPLRSSLTVHPRRCGEHNVRTNTSGHVFGSSPQVRGTRSGNTVLFAFSRFIPAGAGNTCQQKALLGNVPVHPRRCGEHNQCRVPLAPPNGSSPQVRGTLRMSSITSAQRRFIPAGAGNTGTADEIARSDAVHPRRCGEHRQVSPKEGRPRGSSPQVRGTLSAGEAVCEIDRFIPAGAGNTEAANKKANGSSVHPRRCGEHNHHRCLPPDSRGSSPQVRGTRTFGNFGNHGRRFIPAGAGNTSWSGNASTQMTVHPRRCGEHLS